MHVLLIPVGSSGDVHPFLGIGTELKKRGHQVTVLTNNYFRGITERSGLTFQELGTAEEYMKAADNPDLWHPTRSFPLIAQMSSQLLLPTVEAIKKFNVPGKSVVVAGSLGLGARIAEEKWGIPTVTIHLQPSVFRSVYNPPHLPGLKIPHWFPAAWIRGAYGLVDFIADKAFKPLNEYRRELHLAPVKGIMGAWLNSPRMTIGLFPDWYAPRQKDWPTSVQLTGFPLYDGDGVEESDPETETFLKSGSIPLVFTAGSAMKMDRRFFEESDRAVRLLGCRALYVTRYPEQLPPQISVTARHIAYAPFSRLFPRAAALIHHGGIGTVAQALHSGRPQLVVPRAHDQFDNADRVSRLGVGQTLSYGNYRYKTVAKMLKRILSNKRMEENGQRVAGYFDSNAVTRTVELIESAINYEN